MAAPANLKEFEGNVVAVLTENCWDMELDGNGDFSNEVRQVFDDLQKAGKREQALLERMQTGEFKVREYKVLQLGKSNAVYHCLGSAKILTQIGKAFAEAMPEDTVK